MTEMRIHTVTHTRLHCASLPIVVLTFGEDGHGRTINILSYVSMWFFSCPVNVLVFFSGHNTNISMLFIMYYVLCIHALYVPCDLFISRAAGLVACF